MALAIAGWTLLRPEVELGVHRFESPFRASQQPVAFGVNSFTMSPEGSFAVYRGPGEAGVTNQLWVRRWDDLEAVPLRAGELGTQPAVSPDGREIAFTQGNEIKVLSLDGGPVRTLTAGGTYPRWGPDGQIYMGGGVGVTRVAASGGPVDTLTRPAEGESQHWVWKVLPGGEEGLLHINLSNGTVETRVLSLSTGEIRPIDVFGGIPHYVSTGHLVFLEFTAATLMAAPFDAKAAELTGPAVPLYEDVVMFSLARDGTLMYSTGAANAGADELVWVDRRGAATPVDPGWSSNRGGGNYGWTLSPDQTKVALRIFTDGNNDIWIKHLPDGPLERLTFDPGEDRQAWWAPDGETVMYIHGPLDDRNIWSKRADGTGDPQLVLDDERSITQGFASPDGETLVFRTAGLTPNIGPRDIVTFRPGVDSAVVQLIGTPDFAEQGPSLSPDGRWIAYTSDETGSDEVYVRPFPDVNTTRIRISTQGGLRPQWAHSGRELFYVDSNRTMVSISVETEPAFRVVGREELFQLGQTYLAGGNTDFYDIALDDQQFLMGRAFLAGDGGTDTRALVLVQNLFEELKERVPN